METTRNWGPCETPHNNPPDGPSIQFGVIVGINKNPCFSASFAGRAGLLALNDTSKDRKSQISDSFSRPCVFAVAFRRVSFGRGRRLRIAILGESPCDGCEANCCKQKGHAFAVLLEGEKRRRFAPYSMDHPFRQGTVVSLERVIPYRDGRCPFLGEDDLCTIYENRPANCRRFQCIEAFHHRGSDVGSHGVFLERNPDVLARLEKL